MIKNSPLATDLISTLHFRSKLLRRDVRIDIFLPPDNVVSKNEKYRLLLLNDGQDWEQLHLPNTLALLYARKMPPTLIAAIHAGKRIQEYGIAAMPDYKKRGSKAGLYSLFVTSELLPYLQEKYQISSKPQHRAIAGCSLGGLSAFDIAWHFPELFGNVGVFSGSFWWRSKALDDNYTENDRIMHQLLQQSVKREGLKIWLQTGTNDETADRNQNGIIDAIDDTLDIIAILQNKGYKMGTDIRYLQMENGQHNQATWAKALPDFLKWVFISNNKTLNS
jgi:enterochelin esterase family protein